MHWAADEVEDGGDRLLDAVLGSMPHGFAIWDEEGRLKLFNQPYLDIYGYTAADVRVGMTLKDMSRLTVAHGNHPGYPAEEMHAHFLQRLRATVNGKIVRSQSLVRGRTIRATHLSSPGLGWIVVHEDVSDDVAREAALEAEHSHFTAAIDSMKHGLSMYDGELNLIVCNRGYRELYGLPEELAQPGTALRAILEHRAASGAVGLEGQLGIIEDVIDEQGYREQKVQLYRLANGRMVSVTRTPMQPAGFVAIHQDITDEVARIEALKASQSAMALQAMRLDAAINNMTQGLAMFDRDERLVICNEAYARMHRMPPELAAPGTPRQLIIEHRLANGMNPVRGLESFDIAHWRLSEGEKSRTATIELGDGRLISIQHTDMPDGGWVATHRDVTDEHNRVLEIEARERESALQTMRLDAAVNNIRQGLCMFDGSKRLVICNAAYATMYRLPEALTRPGTELSDILGYRFSHGMGPAGGTESYYEKQEQLIADRTFGSHLVEQEDGRWVMIYHQPTAEGGWVATHEDITEQRQTEARIRHLARHDALTDLPNRVLFREEMEKAETRIRRGESLALICVDLDRFKAVNDTLGHAIGDAVLTEVAARLKTSSRAGDIVTRLGGDEFAILAGGLAAPNEAATIAARVVKSMALPIVVEGQHVLIGASAGIAVAPGDGTDGETLLKNADLALYRSKSEGRGTYHFFEKGMDEALQRRRVLERGMKQALARGEFRLVYQPLLDLGDGHISCVEALLRWDHPERGTIMPLEFIPLAEETGVIGAIGEWVLREACRVAADWPGQTRVAVNLSPVQFKNRALVNQVRSALDEAGLEPGRLELEITESLLLADTATTLETLHRLRALGVRIAMDDFGTGYSSLSYLRAFPFDKIKIDRSFLQGLRPDDDSESIIKAIIGLGRSLGMATTAEGIETEEQLATVRAQGCDEAQGFLFSPPLPASGIDALLRTPPGRRKADTAAA